MKITIILEVPSLKKTEDAQDYALNLVEHIAETFNDDNSIKCFWTHIPKTRKERKP